MHRTSCASNPKKALEIRSFRYNTNSLGDPRSKPIESCTVMHIFTANLELAPASPTHDKRTTIRKGESNTNAPLQQHGHRIWKQKRAQTVHLACTNITRNTSHCAVLFKDLVVLCNSQRPYWEPISLVFLATKYLILANQLIGKG